MKIPASTGLTAPERLVTTAAMSLPVIPIDHLAMSFEPWRWPFAEAHRAEIDAHFAARRAQRPHMWNGRVLLTSRYRLAEGRLAGACFETDFASFLAWRDWGFPDAGAVNCFAMGALRSRDGAFLLGVMGSHTANAGRIYFPAGTPEPADLADGALDLAGNVGREVAEETGLTADDYVATPGWHAVPAGARLALIKVLEADVLALELQRRMRAHIGRDADPELADIRIVRGPGDFDAMMPDFVTAFLAHALC
jgi:8-oxo-dGTP pyrophosphatase MutT (NUDIX family)